MMNHNIFIIFLQSPLANAQEEYTIIEKVGFTIHCSEGEQTLLETVGCLSKKIIGRAWYIEYELIYGDLGEVLRKQTFVLSWIYSGGMGNRMIGYLNKYYLL